MALNDGATAIIDNKPFALEVSPHTRNGCAFEIDFETFNVDDEDGSDSSGNKCRYEYLYLHSIHLLTYNDKHFFW